LSTELNEKIEFEVQSYVHDIFALTDEYMQRINTFTKPFRNFLRLKKGERDGSKTQVILMLSQYGSKEELEQEVKNSQERIKNIEEKLSKTLKIMKTTLKGGSIKCPECKGTGRITKVRYIREGGVVTPFFTATDCPACKGEGVIKLPTNLHDYLATAVGMAEKVKTFGSNFLKTLNDLATLLK